MCQFLFHESAFNILDSFLNLKSPQLKSVMALKNVKNKGCFYHALRKKKLQ